MKKVIFMLAAAALVVSCTKTEMTDINADGVLIQAKPMHQLQQVDGSLTRAPFDGNITAGNELEAQVLTFKGAALHANGLMSFASTSNPVAYTSVVSGGKAKFDTGGDTYTMYGLYPKDWNVTAITKPIFTFTGCEDVMATAAATTSEAAVKGGSYPSLTFKHQLTKLVVKVQAMDDAAIAYWGNLKEITLTHLMGSVANVHNTATYDLGANNITIGGGGSPMSFWIINSSQTFTDVAFANQTLAIQKPNAGATNIVPVAYSMVAPFTPAYNKDITLSVTTDKMPATPVNLNVKVLTTGATNTAGYAYTITLTFTDEETIVAIAEVEDWIDGGNIGGVVI